MEKAPVGSTTPASNNRVFVTYFENLIVDDTWTITNELPGIVGVGRYSVVSKLNGTALNVYPATGTTPVPVSGTVQQINPLTAAVESIAITTNSVTKSFTVVGNVKTGTGVTNVGYYGQTYIDSVTGFRVTLDFGQTTGVVNYTVGSPLDSNPTWFFADAGTTEAIPGISLTVQTTDGGAVENPGDTVLLLTIDGKGSEPATGDSYYVTFDEAKTDYTIGYYTTMRDVFTDYGPLDITNKIVVGANLAFLNGAQAVALLQVVKGSAVDAPYEFILPPLISLITLCQTDRNQASSRY